MSVRAGSKIQDPTPPRRDRWWQWDETAYLAPMLAFLLLLQLGTFSKSLYAPAYVARTIAAAVLLIVYWRHYTKIRWNYWWLGVIVGVIGIFQWVWMQNWLGAHFEMFKADKDAFNPFAAFESGAAAWSFIAVRIIGAVLVVPVMEELFWRDYLWRQIMAPNDFKLAAVGEFDWTAFLGVPLAFALVHGSWWLTAIGWALMIGVLLVYTKSLGACIIAHAVTNLLLALYVLHYHAWHLW